MCWSSVWLCLLWSDVYCELLYNTLNDSPHCFVMVMLKQNICILRWHILNCMVCHSCFGFWAHLVFLGLAIYPWCANLIAQFFLNLKCVLILIFNVILIFLQFLFFILVLEINFKLNFLWYLVWRLDSSTWLSKQIDRPFREAWVVNMEFQGWWLIKRVPVGRGWWLYSDIQDISVLHVAALISF